MNQFWNTLFGKLSYNCVIYVVFPNRSTVTFKLSQRYMYLSDANRFGVVRGDDIICPPGRSAALPSVRLPGTLWNFPQIPRQSYLVIGLNFAYCIYDETVQAWLISWGRVVHSLRPRKYDVFIIFPTCKIHKSGCSNFTLITWLILKLF